MHRDDESPYLLYIEPIIEQKSSIPVDDELTHVMEKAFGLSKSGTADYSNLNDKGDTFCENNGWRGKHINCDEKMSSNNDYMLENGMITNSLCVHYVRWFREAISDNDMKKIKELKKYYKNQ